MGIKALVLAGDGINCEQETAAAAKEAGFEVAIRHVNDLLKYPRSAFKGISFFLIPGGFSFGDELGSGKVLALKLKHGLGAAFDDYILGGGLILGICNGFQVLTQLEVFGKGVALAHNREARFLNRWVELEVTGASVFTTGMEGTKLELPIRHGEGRLVFANSEIITELRAKKSFVLKYSEDVNGSFECVAGLSSHDGRVLGLMPHPEAFWTEELHPEGGMQRTLGTKLFQNAYNFLNRR